MKPALTADQTRALEKYAGSHLRLSEAQLMELAGAALAQEAMGVASSTGRFVVVCGRGNNGGDGLVAARQLAARGRAVHVELVSPSGLAALAQKNLEALHGSSALVGPVAADFEARPGDVVVDAIFGTGLHRAPEGEFGEAIARIAKWRQGGAKVVAADLPSGVSSDSGRAFAPCVQADRTVSFGTLKVGHLIEPGAGLSGEVRVADIGLPDPDTARTAGPRTSLLEERDIKDRVPWRRRDSHKGTYGHVLAVAGSPGKSGAAALCGLGALRAGAGLLTIAARSDSLDQSTGFAPELMGLALGGAGPLGLDDVAALATACEGKQALVIGPGIPRGAQTGALILKLVSQLQIPCVIDADGLNALGEQASGLSSATAPVLLTPHPGEMARLLGVSTAEVQLDRIGRARELAGRCGAAVILKGARTVIALPTGETWVNPTGNPGMATAGTGDVLAGMCAGFLAQGLSREDAAMVSPYLHGLAGDRAVRRTGQAGLVASDVLAGLQEIWVAWDR